MDELKTKTPPPQAAPPSYQASAAQPPPYPATPSAVAPPYPSGAAAAAPPAFPVGVAVGKSENTGGVEDGKLALMRAMVPGVADDVLKSYLDGAGGDINIAVNHYFEKQ